MILLANFLLAVAQVLKLILDIYLFILIGRVIISWLNADPYNPIVRFICSATDPLLYKIRRKVPLNMGSLDFSPIILVALIYFLQIFLVQSVSDYAHKIKYSQVLDPRIVQELNEPAK